MYLLHRKTLDNKKLVQFINFKILKYIILTKIINNNMNK